MTTKKEAQSFATEELLAQLRELDLESDLYLTYYNELRRRDVIEEGRGFIYWLVVVTPAVPIFGLHFDLFRFTEQRAIPKEGATLWLMFMLLIWGLGIFQYTVDMYLCEKYAKENR